MTGLVPDSSAAAVPVVDASGAAVGDVPQTGLFTSFGTHFTIAGGLSYLQVPSALGACGGRVTPGQMNYVVSELLALAQAFDPSFTFDPARGDNLARAFAASAANILNGLILDADAAASSPGGPDGPSGADISPADIAAIAALVETQITVNSDLGYG